MKIIWKIFVLFFNINFISSNIKYIPFNAEKNETINSIFGTGDRLKDISYRAFCAVKCGHKSYKDEFCCEGNTIHELKCLDRITCDKITGDFKDYVIKVALITYFVLLIITAIVVGLVYYKLTKDKKYKCKNTFASAIIVICSGTIIPIIILEIYCCCKKKKLADIFGANFEKIEINDLMTSVEVKEQQKKVQFPEAKSSGIDNASNMPAFEMVEDDKSYNTDRTGQKLDKTTQSEKIVEI